MEDSVRHEYIEGDGVRLHVAIAGQGPPVVLLHGFPENWHSWHWQIAPLTTAGYSVWMPDMRGYPLSDIPAQIDAYHLGHLVNDVAAIIAATGYPRAHLVGHDWGGIVAWTFAGVYPLLLNKLVILNAPHMKLYTAKLWRSAQLVRSAYVLFFQLPALPEYLLSRRNFKMVRDMFRHLPANKAAFSDRDIDNYIKCLSLPGALTAALNYYRANLRSDGIAMARSARIDADTLVIWGELDPALDKSLLEGLEQVAPRVRVHRIAGASHWVQNEAPQEVNHALVDFLAQRAPEEAFD